MKRSLFNFATLILLVYSAAAQQPIAALPRAMVVAPVAANEAASAEKIWSGLLEGNERFVAGMPNTRALVGLRASLAKGQHPHVIVLACSDSRVAPELLFDQSLGDLFVIRAAGNVADAVGLGSMEYAVEHLGSSVLVVLGHSKCGAVTAACSKEHMPTANLQAIVDKISPAVTLAGESAKGDALIEAAVKQNIHQSARDVLANSEVLRHAAEEGKLTVFEVEYSLETGRVTRLEQSASH